MTKNIRLYPSKQFIFAGDKMTKNIFDLTKTSTARGIVEDKRTGIITPLKIKFAEEFKDRKGLTAFDEIVCNACLSEQSKGNQYTTLAIIHRAIGGSETKFHTADKERILESIKKLGATWISFDMTAICEKFGYNNGKGFKYSGSLLPLETVEATVNGKLDSAAIHFLRESPLFTVAEMKGQVLVCDRDLLKVPNMHNTTNVSTLKAYLLKRILQIKGSHEPHKKHFTGKDKDGKPIFRQVKRLEKTILLETLYTQCGLADATKRQQQQARETIQKVMEHFKVQKLISEWHFERKNGTYHSLKFDW